MVTMTEEPTKKEEKALSVLEQIKAEREAVEKANAEADGKIATLRELQANELLSGKADAGKPAEKPAEISPKEYAENILKGEV